MKFLSCLPALCLTVFFHSHAFSQTSDESIYSEQEITCIADKIFYNECGSEKSKLADWNSGESFPSLGIGHFIWMREDDDSPYAESFPLLMKFYDSKTVAIPKELSFLRSSEPPWQSREDFLRAKSAGDLDPLINFLEQTKEVQAEFMMKRTIEFLQIAEKYPDFFSEQQLKNLHSMKSTTKGRFALMDYINFKGEGLHENEAYKGTRWGVSEVLNSMGEGDSDTALSRFVESAEQVLRKRIKNAPDPETEMKWLPGWLNRIRSYQNFTCMTLG